MMYEPRQSFQNLPLPLDLPLQLGHFLKNVYFVLVGELYYLEQHSQGEEAFLKR